MPFYRGIQASQGKMLVLNSVCKVRDISLSCFLADPVFSRWEGRWAVESMAGDTSCRVPGMYFFNVSLASMIPEITLTEIFFRP